MAKYHITAAGDPAPCKATKKACPRGGADEHYESKEAAAQAYEQKMDAQMDEVFGSHVFPSHADEEFREKVARARRVEDAVLKVDPNKTVRPVPSEKQLDTWDGNRHNQYYVHPDLQKELQGDEDLKEYLVKVHLDLSEYQLNNSEVRYDPKARILDVSHPFEEEPPRVRDRWGGDYEEKDSYYRD